MTRLVAVLALLGAFTLGHSAIGYQQRPYRVGVVAGTGVPYRGPSRDRSLPGKSRRHARRAG